MLMEKYWMIVEEVINESDFVIEVVDSRMIESTRNKRAEDYVRKNGKQLIIVASKSDLVSEETIEYYRRKFRRIPFFFVSVREREGVTHLKKKMFEIIKKRSKTYMISISVIGYPNTGKSSLINALSGKRKTNVGSKPGMTRSIQWIKLVSNIRFIDTPGVIPMSDDDEVKQIMMNTLDPSNSNRVDEAAREIVKTLLKHDRDSFEKLYNIETNGKTFEKIVEGIGKLRKMMIKGGKIDKRRVHLRIIDDWQKGKIIMKKQN
ncbi:MAG: GTPase [Candidatus Aenigmatarchaeota archaeon]